MKSYQLIKYNTRNIFLEKSYTKCGGEASPKLFPKKIKIGHTPRSTVSSVVNLFLLYVQNKINHNILKLRCWPLDFILCKAF